MRIVVVSCMKYSDAWSAFFFFFRKFWPDCPYPLFLVTDGVPSDFNTDVLHPDLLAFVSGKLTWNEILADFVSEYNDEPIMLFLEDYFLTSKVNEATINYALELMHKCLADCVRLYPCPGGDFDFGDPLFAVVIENAAYRISTQVAIWDPMYLLHILNSTISPQDFEIAGTKLSRELHSRIIAFKRDVQPWPLEYICTAIVRGVWQLGAIEHCKKHGIELDLTRRPVQTI